MGILLAGTLEANISDTGRRARAASRNSTRTTTTMPSDQSTWLIAIPNDGDAEGVLPEITSKLAQPSRSSQAAIAEFAIPAFKVAFRSSFTPHGSHLTPDSEPVDWHTRRPHHPLRGTPEAGRVLHFRRRQDRRHPAQPPQQRPGKARSTRFSERTDRRRLHFQRLAMERRQIRRAKKPARDRRRSQ